MREIYILYETTTNFVSISCDIDKLASVLYSDIYIAKLTNKDILLIHGSNGYSRFITPSKILDF